jgi:hypothetical protein
MRVVLGRVHGILFLLLGQASAWDVRLPFFNALGATSSVPTVPTNTAPLEAPVRTVLNRAVLLYDQLASLERGRTAPLDYDLTDQLTQVIVTLGQQVRYLEEPIKSKPGMSIEQVLLWSRLLDRLETKMTLTRQKQTTASAVAATDVEAWRALHQAAQLIEQAMERKVPLAQLHALVECKCVSLR